MLFAPIFRVLAYFFISFVKKFFGSASVNQGKEMMFGKMVILFFPYSHGKPARLCRTLSYQA